MKIKLVLSFLLIFIVAFTLIVSMAHAQTPTPTQFGVIWAQSFNKTATRKNEPFRFLSIACKYTKVKGQKEKFYACDTLVLDKRDGKQHCIILLISPEGNIVGGEKYKCKKGGAL